MPQRFVILTNGRSGSTLLVDLLKSHPDIDCEPEVLNESRWKQYKRPVLWLLRAWPIPYLEWRAQRCRKAVYGFKLKTGGQVYNLAHTTRMLFQRGWQLIYLSRRDILQQTLSWSVAQATNRWQTTPGREYDQRRVQLDKDLFLRNYSTAQQNKLQLAAMMRTLPNLALVYEDDLARSDSLPATSARLCDFLGVQQAVLSSTLIPTWDRPYSEIVSNYVDLMAAVEKSAILEKLR